MISLVVAIAKNNVIGSKNELPWYLPEDLKRFKQITMGHTVLMGRKTYESILARLGKPLPGRTSVVVTRQEKFAAAPVVLIFHSLDQALAALKQDNVFIIGGAEIFRQTLPQADILYVTHVHKAYPGDIFFPEINWDEWEKMEEESHEEFTFSKYTKKGSDGTRSSA